MVGFVQSALHIRDFALRHHQGIEAVHNGHHQPPPRDLCFRPGNSGERLRARIVHQQRTTQVLVRIAQCHILMDGIVRDEDRCAPEHLLVCLCVGGRGRLRVQELRAEVCVRQQGSAGDGLVRLPQPGFGLSCAEFNRIATRAIQRFMQRDGLGCGILRGRDSRCLCAGDHAGAQKRKQYSGHIDCDSSSNSRNEKPSTAESGSATRIHRR